MKTRQTQLSDVITWQELIDACDGESKIQTAKILDMFGDRIPGKDRTGKGMKLARFLRRFKIYPVSHRFPNGIKKGYATCDLESARDGETNRYIKPKHKPRGSSCVARL